MRTGLRRPATVAGCVLALAMLTSATSAARDTPTPVRPATGRAPSATGIEEAVRRYLGGSASTRLVIALPVVHGNRASVAVEWYASPLAGEGRTVELDRVHGQWQVVSVGARPDWVNWAGVRPRRGA